MKSSNNTNFKSAILSIFSFYNNKKNAYSEFIFFFLSFYALLIIVPDNDYKTLQASTSDNGQHIKETYDRKHLQDIFSLTKQTWNENANSHYVPITTLLFNILFFLDQNKILPIFYAIIAFHVLNAILFKKTLSLFMKNSLLNRVGTLLFLFHPSCIAVLSWLAAGFNHTISLLLCLTTLLLWIKYLKTESKYYLIVCLISLCLALAMKPITYFLPFSLTSLTLFPFIKLVDDKKIKIRSILHINALLICAILPFFVIESFKYPQGNVAKNWGGMGDITHTFLRSINLLESTLRNIIPGEENYFVIGFVMFFTLTMIFTYSILNKEAIIFFWLSWIAGSCVLFLSSNFRDIDTLNRYQYIPLCGLIFISVYIINKISLSRKSGK